MSGRGEVVALASGAAVVERAARSVEEACALAAGRRVAVALSGGSTPEALFRFLAGPWRERVPWERLEVFFGDERAVPPDHPESNYRLAWAALLSHVPVPARQVHRMPAEESDLDTAARRYEEEIRRSVAPGPGGVPAFDLIWLGVGEDGHTASLYPGTGALLERERLVVENRVPGLAAPRLTFTFPLLDAARRIQFLVTGARKAPIVRALLGPRPSPAPGPLLPAARVAPRAGKLEWLLDREAAGALSIA